MTRTSCRKTQKPDQHKRRLTHNTVCCRREIGAWRGGGCEVRACLEICNDVKGFNHPIPPLFASGRRRKHNRAGPSRARGDSLQTVAWLCVIEGGCAPLCVCREGWAGVRTLPPGPPLPSSEPQGPEVSPRPYPFFCGRLVGGLCIPRHSLHPTPHPHPTHNPLLGARYCIISTFSGHPSPCSSSLSGHTCTKGSHTFGHAGDVGWQREYHAVSVVAVLHPNPAAITEDTPMALSSNACASPLRLPLVDYYSLSLAVTAPVVATVAGEDSDTVSIAHWAVEAGDLMLLRALHLKLMFECRSKGRRTLIDWAVGGDTVEPSASVLRLFGECATVLVSHAHIAPRGIPAKAIESLLSGFKRACQDGKLELAQALMQTAGPLLTPHVLSRDWWLQDPAGGGHYEVVRYLLELGLNPKADNAFCLHRAMRAKKEDVVALLSQAVGAKLTEVASRPREYGCTLREELSKIKPARGSPISRDSLSAAATTCNIVFGKLQEDRISVAHWAARAGDTALLQALDPVQLLHAGQPAAAVGNDDEDDDIAAAFHLPGSVLTFSLAGANPASVIDCLLALWTPLLSDEAHAGMVRSTVVDTFVAACKRRLPHLARKLAFVVPPPPHKLQDPLQSAVVVEDMNVLYLLLERGADPAANNGLALRIALLTGCESAVALFKSLPSMSKWAHLTAQDKEVRELAADEMEDESGEEEESEEEESEKEESEKEGGAL